jgi:hypothetical protein
VQREPHPLAAEVRAVNLGTLSQTADIALIEGLFKLEGVETLDLSSTSGTGTINRRSIVENHELDCLAGTRYGF